jgi:transposase
MGPYPIELRQRVVDEHVRGKGSLTEVAEQFGVSRGFVRDMVAQYRRTGSIRPRAHGGGRHKLGPKGDAKLIALVEADPDATLDELRARLRRSRHIALTRSGVGRALQRLGLPRKKSRSMRPSRTGPMSGRHAQPFNAVRGTATRSDTCSSTNSASTSR